MFSSTLSSNSDHKDKQSAGHIELFIGPMFAGKSTELLRRVKRHEIAGRRCLSIKYNEDSRYSNECIATHDKQLRKATSLSMLSSMKDDWKSFDVIGIDEGQFFKDIVQFSEQAANEGKIVIISALDGTYLRTGFDNILQLIPLAEKVKKLRSICRECSMDASYTFRTVDSDDLELIGDGSMYKPLCRACYISETDKQNKKKAAKMESENLNPVQEFKIEKEENNSSGKPSASSLILSEESGSPIRMETV